MPEEPTATTTTTLDGVLTRLVPTTEDDLDVPVGYAQFWHADAPEDGTEGGIESGTEGGIDLVLQPASQGRGLGPDATRALLAHVGGELGWRRVTVDPVRENVRAVRAWEKAGFRQVPSETGEPLLEFRFPEGRRH
ncbi:GNAT family N-acetyltransferase [Streptomyces griseus]|uniref:GNAT family N-acetyltransferase n=1 Tax=Streptomyces griseus TaxID=1911 RepID=UPI00403CF890